uniref:Uncharacterized protein n=1 Tax=viral metagenome TaxID=1070528 RepID=A0A6M3L801_9ZZZZ
MNDHCKYEGDLSRLKQICENDIPQIRASLREIERRLVGGNGEGLATRVAINREAIREMRVNFPTMRKAMVWGSVWGGVSGAVTIATFFGVKAIAG